MIDCTGGTMGDHTDVDSNQACCVFFLLAVILLIVADKAESN